MGFCFPEDEGAVAVDRQDEIIQLLKEIRDNQLVHLKHQARSLELQELNTARLTSQADRAANFMDGYNRFSRRLLKPAIVVLVVSVVVLVWHVVR